jgi:hypothetical protein
LNKKAVTECETPQQCSPIMWPGLETLLLRIAQDVSETKQNVASVSRGLADLKLAVAHLQTLVGAGNTCHRDRQDGGVDQNAPEAAGEEREGTDKLAVGVGNACLYTDICAKVHGRQLQVHVSDPATAVPEDDEKLDLAGDVSDTDVEDSEKAEDLKAELASSLVGYSVDALRKRCRELGVRANGGRGALSARITTVATAEACPNAVMKAAAEQAAAEKAAAEQVAAKTTAALEQVAAEKAAAESAAAEQLAAETSAAEEAEAGKAAVERAAAEQLAAETSAAEKAAAQKAAAEETGAQQLAAETAAAEKAVAEKTSAERAAAEQLAAEMAPTSQSQGAAKHVGVTTSAFFIGQRVTTPDGAGTVKRCDVDGYNVQQEGYCFKHRFADVWPDTG